MTNGFPSGATLPLYLSNALCGENGEFAEQLIMYLLLSMKTGKFANLVKHLIGGGTHKKTPPTRAEVIEELADIHIYTILNCETLGVGEEEFMNAVHAKVAKNVERMKMPVKRRTRAERRRLRAHIIKKRWKKIAAPDQTLTPGHTAKWNLTCSCPMCKAKRYKRSKQVV